MSDFYFSETRRNDQTDFADTRKISGRSSEELRTARHRFSTTDKSFQGGQAGV